MKKFWLVALLLNMLGSTSYAVENSPALKSRLSSQKATLGQSISFWAMLTCPDGTQGLPLDAQLSLAGLKVRELHSYPARIAPGKKVYLYQVVFSSFELGQQSFPAISFSFKDSSGRLSSLITEPQAFEIVLSAPHPHEKDTPKPMKGPASLGFSKLWRVGLGALAGLLSILFGALVYRRLSFRPDVDPEAHLPAEERLRREWGRLKNTQWLMEGKWKDFYTEFVLIIKRYLNRRYQMDTLESTTSELGDLLGAKGLSQLIVAKIVSLMEVADLIKFAKQKGENTSLAKLEQDLMEIVQWTKPEAPEKK